MHAALGLDATGATYERLVAFGGRSFSILNGDAEIVFDSGADFENEWLRLIEAGSLPEAAFNCDNDGAELDSRSDRRVRLLPTRSSCLSPSRLGEREHSRRVRSSWYHCAG